MSGATYIIKTAFREVTKMQNLIQNEIGEKENIIRRLEESEEKYRIRSS